MVAGENDAVVQEFEPAVNLRVNLTQLLPHEDEVDVQTVASDPTGLTIIAMYRVFPARLASVEETVKAPVLSLNVVM